MCFLLEQHNYLNKLGEYLNEEEYKPENSILTSTKALQLDINTQTKVKVLRHTFKNFTGVGRAKEVLLQRVQSELKLLQKEIGFRHIKFHGILDDAMMLYNEDRQGNPYLTFTYVDELIDFLLSINLKPFIQFSFMPRLLAKNTERTLFFNPVIISEPKDYGKWEYLITGLTQHLIQRYGILEVRSWLFSFWNVPFLSYLFSFETNEIAYELYKRTRHCVKTCDKALQFGNPSFGSLNFVSSELYSFLDFCKAGECYPDFYNIHCYPVKIPDRDSLASLNNNIGWDHKDDSDTVILSNDADFMANVISEFKGKITAYPKLPTYITEWASTSSHRDWLNDTCYRSVYIVKNILENYDDVESFGNWCLSDTFEELPLDNDEFHGELGLFTSRGIKKPAYYAFVFLNKLMDYLVERGKGYFITTNQNGDYAILLYNYHHISQLYAQGVLFNVTFTERYNAFVDTHSLDFDLSLHLLPNGRYILTEHILNREHGSAFDEWVRMGGLPLVTQEEIDILRGRSIPKLMKQEKIIANESLYYTASLMPFEVRLIIIQRQYFC
jgi:xylan 1,4-beta-xylosidase